MIIANQSFVVPNTLVITVVGATIVDIQVVCIALMTPPLPSVPLSSEVNQQSQWKAANHTHNCSREVRHFIMVKKCKDTSSSQSPDLLLKTGAVTDCIGDLILGCTENNQVLREHTVSGVIGVIASSLNNSGFVRVPGSSLPTYGGAPWVVNCNCVA